MLIYDRRLQYFGEKGNVRGRQGVDLLRYGRDKVENIEKAYLYLKESTQLRKLKTSDAVLASYISCSIILYQNEINQVDQVITDYLLVTDLLNEKLSKKPGDSKIEKLKSAIDENFINEGPSDCETIIEYFSEQLEAKSEDIVFLQMLTSLLRNRDCTDSELFFNSSKSLHKLSPSSESALNIAIMAFKNEDFAEAIEYYQQAIVLETDEDKKADYFFGISASYSGLKDRVKSREFARKALSVRPNWGEPYILIGQLYAESKDLCNSITLPNSIYWVAVDMFEKAKSVDPSVSEKANSLILTYSRYYPNKEEAFFENIHKDSRFTVGCWINETTKARFYND